MGDRAIVQFENYWKELSPAVYLHWGGSNVKSLLSELRQLMKGHENDIDYKGRENDIDYTCARFIGIIHAHDPESNLSLGVWNQPTRLVEKNTHGDAGCFVVNVKTWKVDVFGGYGFAREDDD